MTEERMLAETLADLGAIVYEILCHSKAPEELKAQLESLTPNLKEALPPHQKAEIEAIEARLILPEILRRIQ